MSHPCLHGSQDEVGTTKHSLSARCPYIVIGWVSMLAYEQDYFYVPYCNCFISLFPLSVGFLLVPGEGNRPLGLLV